MVLIQLGSMYFIYIISQVQLFSYDNRFGVCLSSFRNQAKPIGYHPLVFNIYLLALSFKDLNVLMNGVNSLRISTKPKQKWLHGPRPMMADT